MQGILRQRRIRILFLGAAKRVSLLERFYEAAAQLNISLEIYSCELKDDFYPISRLAKILSAPAFLAPEFQIWLDAAIKDHLIDIIIPNMDAATVALSEYKFDNPNIKSWAVVSDHNICAKMYDKVLSSVFFQASGISCPPNTPDKFPKILKPRFGFGSKGIRVAYDQKELDCYLANSECDYLVQDLLLGAHETTVDFFVSSSGSFIGSVLRDRLEVSDGEVMVCQTRLARPEESRLIETVAYSAKWEGCITLQYLSYKDSLYAIEINPRFGGGSTCAIEAGLDMPRYILSEFLGQDVVPPIKIKSLRMTRARRDFFNETT